MFSSPSFSPQYRAHVNMANPKWRLIRRVTFLVTCGRDVLIPLLPAQQADHLTYKRLGHEIPWFDLVPLHGLTHKIVTFLRRAGLALPVNLVLRAAILGWLSLWFYLGALVGQICGVLHGVPSPLVVLQAAMIQAGRFHAFMAHLPHVFP